MKYEFLDHTSEIKIKSYGKTQEETLQNLVLAISEYLSKNQKISSKKAKTIQAHGTDKENLLYNFIDELIYLYDAEYFIPLKAEITLLGNNIKATIYGDDTKNYHDLDHIKAATFSEMEFKKTDKEWIIQVVLDV